MKRADLVFTDGPWNQGNMHSFYTKAAQTFAATYASFQEALFSVHRPDFISVNLTDRDIYSKNVPPEEFSEYISLSVKLTDIKSGL